MLVPDPAERGFTLVELSVVLVVVGLIVGGVLVGQDLIKAAEVRAQVTQVEKFKTAVNMFRSKYDALPGDIKDPDASSFGFASRGPYEGQGDGNGVIEGNWDNAPGANAGVFQGTGETGMFWVDLSIARLLDVNLNHASSTLVQGAFGTVNVDAFFPQSKIGKNYVYAWSLNGTNYFGLSVINSLGTACAACVTAYPGLTVQQAYSIDQKVDDGFPLTGNITSRYINPNFTWAGASDTSATGGSTSSCDDNGNVAGAAQHYSVEISNGSNTNCALSFRFQ